MNSKKIVALLLCLGLSFQSTALSGVLYDENAVVKASAEESGKTADAESYSGTEQSENKAQQPESSAERLTKLSTLMTLSRIWRLNRNIVTARR